MWTVWSICYTTINDSCNDSKSIPTQLLCCFPYGSCNDLKSMPTQLINLGIDVDHVMIQNLCQHEISRWDLACVRLDFKIDIFEKISDYIQLEA